MWSVLILTCVSVRTSALVCKYRRAEGASGLCAAGLRTRACLCPRLRTPTCEIHSAWAVYAAGQGADTVTFPLPAGSFMLLW